MLCNLNGLQSAPGVGDKYHHVAGGTARRNHSLHQGVIVEHHRNIEAEKFVLGVHCHRR
jgi:hypothetical protein